MRIAGITGTIASGKSTVAGILRDRYGVPVADADQAGRDVTTPGSPALDEIRRRLGDRFIGDDGTLDRRSLRDHVAADPDARQHLEAILHPAIYRELDRWCRLQEARGAPLVAVEASLLVETGNARRYDLLVVVSCSEETSIRRLVAHRGFTEAQARAWIGSQLPAHVKEGLADVVIRNEGTLADLEAEVARAWPALSGGLPAPGQ